MSDYTEDKQAKFPELLKIRKALSEKYFCTGATLIEENNDTDNRPFKMEVDLKGYHHLTYLLYQFDDDKYPYALLPFFSDEKDTGLHRMCDYISFVETDDSMYVILFELKKGNTDKNCAKAKRQLKAGECFVKYIEATLSRIGQSLDKEVKYRSILLLDPKSNRKLTKGEKREYDKDGYIKLCQGTVQLNMLVKYPLAE